MIDSGDVKKLGAGAVLTYLVIKSYVDLEKGISFPSLDLVAVKTGASLKTTHTHVKKLVEAGYVKKLETNTKHNVYRVVENIKWEQPDNEGKKHQLQASWDYVPLGVQQAVSEIKNVALTGALPENGVVEIKNLTVNIQVAPQATTAVNQINLNEIQNPTVRKALESLLATKDRVND